MISRVQYPNCTYGPYRWLNPILKWCIHLNRSLFCISTTWWVSLLGRQESPRGHMYSSCTIGFDWFVAFGEHHNFLCLKLNEIVVLLVHFTTPFCFSLIRHFLGVTLLISALWGHHFATVERTSVLFMYLSALLSSEKMESQHSNWKKFFLLPIIRKEYAL